MSFEPGKYVLYNKPPPEHSSTAEIIPSTGKAVSSIMGKGLYYQVYLRRIIIKKYTYAPYNFIHSYHPPIHNNNYRDIFFGEYIAKMGKK
ncbi:hypothetical protein DWU89_08335 [Parabacteroides acidifaciens]|uniref:Uncharacterized protein n=1 Tax=Parabacteroides acidifaciens TaxID=2290935 RepID=A0A3D8HG30_9BACT|nr:hypothetical protein DWU89_08335 [Parabacteroides acidifaciens]